MREPWLKIGLIKCASPVSASHTVHTNPTILLANEWKTAVTHVLQVLETQTMTSSGMLNVLFDYTGLLYTTNHTAHTCFLTYKLSLNYFLFKLVKADVTKLSVFITCSCSRFDTVFRDCFFYFFCHFLPSYFFQLAQLLLVIVTTTAIFRK